MARVIRYNVVNLIRERWQTSAGTYADAVRVASELETATGQLHGVERG